MAFYEMLPGAGMPSGLQADMDSVLNKKFGTSTTYPAAGWPDDVNLMGMLEEKTVSGAIATFADGADAVPLKSLVVNLPASLTAYEEVNVVHCGKNLIDIRFSQVNTSNILSNTFSLKAGTYTLSVNYSGTPTWGVYLREGSTVSSPTISNVYNSNILTFTLAEDKAELCISMYYVNGISISEVTNIMLEVGSSQTTFEAYQEPTTYNIDIPNPNPNLRPSADVDEGMWTTNGTINPSSGGGFGRALTMAVSEKTAYDIYGLLDDLIVYLDSNKTMLSYERLSNTSLSLQNERKTTPANCAYIGLSALAFDVSSVSVKESFLVRGGSIDAINGDGVNGCSKPVSLNSRTWYKTTIGGHDCFYSNLTNGYIGEGSGFVDGDCDSYDVTFDGQMGTDKTICFYYNSNFNFTRCAVRDDQYANLTASEFKAIVDGDMVYQLAESAQTAFDVEPISVDSKANSNNIWNDAGDTEVTYRSQGTVYQYPEGEGVSF